MPGISFVCVLSLCDGKEVGRCIVYGRDDNSAGNNVCRSRVLVAQVSRIKLVSHNKIALVVHSRWRAAEGRSSVAVRGLSDSRVSHRNGPGNSKGGGNAWSTEWRCRRCSICRRCRDVELPHLFWDSQTMKFNALIVTFSFTFFLVE